MTYQNLDEMSQAEFDDLIEGYITRTAAGYGEMPAEQFLNLWLERLIDRADPTPAPSVDVNDSRHNPR